MAQSIALAGIPNEPVLGTAELASAVQNDFQELLYVSDMADVFFNPDTDVITVSYYHSSLRTWKPYSVIYDDPHVSANVGGAEFNTLRPQFQITESILAHRVLKKDKCIIKGTTYYVDDFISDGVGVTTVYVRIS
jgi:hypothetical protein